MPAVCTMCNSKRGSFATLWSYGNIIAGTPMDLVTINILSGLPVVADTSKYILVVCDHFTK